MVINFKLTKVTKKLNSSFITPLLAESSQKKELFIYVYFRKECNFADHY